MPERSVNPLVKKASFRYQSANHSLKGSYWTIEVLKQVCEAFLIEYQSVPLGCKPQRLVSAFLDLSHLFHY